MTDDFTNLETGASCYVLNSATSIYAYKSNIRSSYIQVGGKWFKTSQTNYNTLPSNTICFTYSDITAINSNAAFLPIYEFIAVCLAIFVWFVVYKIISKLWRWRV